jgi:large subunit ribosomal protein L21
MYAVIETGGKQYRVEVGTELEVEYLDVQPGSALILDRVLLVADGTEASIGRPLVADATVSAEVIRQDRGEKLISFKYRPKARSRVKKGHRQELTVLRITDVRLGERSAAAEGRLASEAAQSERQRLEAAAARQAATDAELAAKLAAANAPAPSPAEAPAPKRTRAKAAETPVEPQTDATTEPQTDAGPRRRARTKKES